MEQTGRGRTPIGGLLALIAGGAILVGSLLGWAQVSTPVVAFQGGSASGTSEGIDSVFGIISLAAGSLALLGGLFWIARRSAGLIPAMGVSVAGIVGAAVGLYFFLTLESRYIDAAVKEAASPELTAAKIKDLLIRIFDAGSLDLKPGIGLIVVVAGSALAIVVGIAGLLRRDAGGASARSW
jgi:hypothetical protein